MQLQDIK